MSTAAKLDLTGKTVLVTGSARRIGRALVLAIARAGGDVIIHHSSSPDAAEQTLGMVKEYGRRGMILRADLSDPAQAGELIEEAFRARPVYALVNSAAIFEPLTWADTGIEDWNRHLNINLTAPFLLSQAFARRVGPERDGRIVNILDWRALRPGADHLPYTISKAALVALTRSLAVSLAPGITVNGLALGAVLPPSDGGDVEGILRFVPAGRWADLEEVEHALLFLLSGPAYITGEILHIDGGRHLI